MIKKKRAERIEMLTGIGFILPSLLGFVVFTLIPVIISLFLSFTKWNFMEGWGAIKFTGLENYIRLFTDDWFIRSYLNNILFTVVTVPVLLALGMVIAVIINKFIYGGGVVRVMIFIPYIASVVAVCAVWMVLLQPSYGPINSFLRAIGIENPPMWLADFNWSLPSIMIIYVWQQVGYYSIVFIAGLKGISEDVYEAARVDGASSIRQFFSITIPLLSPTTFFLTIMGIIGSFKVFDQISVLTQGGPGNSSSVMAYYVYRTAFEYFDMGYANTLAWALFLLVFVVTLIQWKLQGRFSNE
ncbi:MAG: sugar ABC transporter permease [Fournierella sp.]|uniref:carbohydrate ABC transporter permease n=1 Tax=Allofournierella sp. TaxID=1940256 RepID=UPI002A834938|nr:sugar ABC transporter permease [Fournierella sp.]MDY4165925.1 sugar ABC transporter permease [Fournierella sp.]